MTICDSSSNPNRRSHLLPLLLTVAWATNTFSCAPDGENTNWPIREANDQRLVKVLIMNQHDNLSQTLFVFGLIKQVQLTLLHCLIVFGFSRYSPLTRFNKIAIQGTHQMAVDKEAICLSRVYSYYPKCKFPLFYMGNPP